MAGMRGSRLVLLVLACLLLGWWLSRPSGRVPAAPVSPTATAPAGAIGTAASVPCPLPPRVTPGQAPLQSPVPASLKPFRLDDASMVPLAGFSVSARVLGREPYRLGREAGYSPLDLALGWNRMTEDAVLGRLSISQGGRWYRYSWQGEPPLPVDEIVRSSANMHMIPADDTVRRALDRISRGDRVRIDGWLVQVDADDGWRWRSSLTREDSGGGACEVVYVCAVTLE